MQPLITMRACAARSYNSQKVINARRSMSSFFPTQITSKTQLAKVAKEKYTNTLEKDLIQIYRDIPKGPAGVRKPTGPIDYYINRYTKEAPGTMLVHAAILVLTVSYIEKRIFDDVTFRFAPSNRY